jgi:hypothetical protein
MKKKIVPKNNRRSGLMPLLVISLLAMGSCEKCDDPCDIDCDNYDPCCGQSPADASFTIYEVLNAPNPTKEREGYTVTPMATDTILRFNTALMEADFKADYYEWTIGDDPRTWNTREVALSFGVQFYIPIPITLKVAKAVDKSCFPDAKDTVTFQRTLVIVPEEDSKAVGRYEGFLNSAPAKPNFLDIQDSVDQYGDLLYGYTGIFPNCDMPNRGGGSFIPGYRSFYLYSQATKLGCCYGLTGYGKIALDGSFRMKMGHYPVRPPDSCFWSGLNDPYLIDEFIGQKIN